MGRRVGNAAAWALAAALVAASAGFARADDAPRGGPDASGSAAESKNSPFLFLDGGTNGPGASRPGGGTGRPATSADWRKWLDLTHAGQDLARAAREKGRIMPFGALMKKAFGPGSAAHALGVQLHRDLFGGFVYVVTTIDKTGRMIVTTISGRDGRVLSRRVR
ncbi:MAG: hypothetical protein KGI57_02845 [Hyphomicrobiales bacterium]|nr:hypothetical protein [Hyphomicrobiales bacterium]MDE2016624.1 hypothetical protein [Hyphomicrobiales bacterium]